jgi:hypothetical protein
MRVDDFYYRPRGTDSIALLIASFKREREEQHSLVEYFWREQMDRYLAWGTMIEERNEQLDDEETSTVVFMSPRPTPRRIDHGRIRRRY